MGSINSRLAAVLVLTLLIIGSFDYATRILPEERSLKNRAQRVAEDISLILTVKVWQLDVAGINRLLSQFPLPEDFHSVRVKTEFGDLLCSRQPGREGHVVNGVARISHKGQIIGSVELSLDSKALGEMWNSTIRIYLMILAFSMVLFVLLNWLLLRRLLAKPLRQLSEDLKNISSGRKHKALESSGLSELDQINDAINRMALQIEERTRQLELEITEHKQVQEQLRLSEQRYRLLAENSDDYICEVREDGRFCYLNPTYEKIGGYSPSELLDRTSFEAFHPDSKNDAMKAFKTMFQEHIPVIFESQVMFKPGKYIWLETHGCPFHAANGEWHAVMISRDITQRKKYEEELERGVATRTSALASANQQLQQEISDREELEARLRFIRAQLYLTEERTRRRIALGLHDEVAQNLAFLKMKIQEFSKFTGHMKNQGVFDEMITIIANTIASVKSLVFEIYPDSLFEMGLEAALSALLCRFREKHPQILFKTSIEGPEVSFQKDVQGLLYHAVRELLTNAIKYAQASSIQLSITRAKQFYHISVQDDGIGFEAALSKPKDESIKGFGLFSIKEQVESMGGQFLVESSPGKGTNCSLRIPVLPNECLAEDGKLSSTD